MAHKNANTLLRDKRTRFVHAHPDDSISDSQLYGHNADEALITLGEKGGDPKVRLKEEEAAAKILGFKKVLTYPGRDGHVQEDIDTLVDMIAHDAIRDKVEVLATTLFTDHDDHIAVKELVLKAAQRMARVGNAVGVLLIHHSSDGEYTTEATQESITRAFQAGLQHQSQWDMRPGIHEDWAVRGGVSVPHDTLAVLEERYPLTRDASYAWLPPEYFLADQNESLALAAR